MNHPNTTLLNQIYKHFAEGRLAEMLEGCSDACTFQVAGKSRLAGKYDKKTFAADFFPRLKEISENTFQMDVHDILASDRHGLVLATNKLVKNQKTIEYRTVHVWRIENGKPVAWYEYPRDLYQYDQIWG